MRNQMNNNQHTYNQPPRGQMMPQQVPEQPRMSVRQRMQDSVRRMQDVFPRWVSIYSIVTYLIALMMVSYIYSSYRLPWYYMLSGIVGAVVFFMYGSKAIKDTSVSKVRKERTYEKRLFLLALIPRVLFMFLMYWISQANYGDAFGFENADATYYDEMGQYVAGLIERGNFHFVDEITKWNGGNEDVADMGYGIYVGFVYWLTGSEGVTTAAAGIGAENESIIIVRLIKCIISSWTVILIYRLAKRNFGIQTARIAAIFCALWPNFWYYCAVHLKETEMVFLCVLFIEQADQMLRSRQFTAWKVIPILLVGAAIFTFRTPLAIVAVIALLFAIVMSSTKVVSWGKRVIVGILAMSLIIVAAGDQIEERAESLIKQVQSEAQNENMEWRAEREHGNAFAKYAGAAVFAPMIFTLPFPTMTQPWEGQNVQQLLNGGNFVKNMISFFTLFAMIFLPPY